MGVLELLPWNIELLPLGSQLGELTVLVCLVLPQFYQENQVLGLPRNDVSVLCL